MLKSSIKTKTVLTMTDMTESTELLAFKRQKDGYKVTVKISLCICVVLRETNSNFGKIYLLATMKCARCATVYWHKSLQFVKKTNTLTLFIYDFIKPVSCFDY